MKRIETAYIIDDDEIILYLADKLIKELDFCKRVENFTDGFHALAKLNQVISDGGNLPDIILFDLNMPVMDGWEFLDEYLKLPLMKEIPLFVFTSSVNQEDHLKSLQFKEIKGFIQKPLTSIKLNKIERLIS